MAIVRTRVGSHEDEKVTLDFWIEDTTNTLADVEYKNVTELDAGMHVTDLGTGNVFNFVLRRGVAAAKRVPIPSGPDLNNVTVGTSYPVANAASPNPRNSR